MRISKKPELLLELLAKHPNKFFSYNELCHYLQLSYRRTQRILCSLQEQGKLCIKKSKQDGRSNFITLQKETKMARLRKREIIEPSIVEIATKGIKETMNRRKKKPKDLSSFLTIPPSILKILNYWNGLECTPNIKIPEPINGVYPVPTETLKRTVKSLRKLIAGTFFSKVPVIELRELNQSFTVDEIIDTIKRYCKAAYSSNYLPYNKEFLAKKKLLDVLFYEQASYLKDKSIFMHFYHNPPNLTAAIEVQKMKMEEEAEKDFKLKRTKRDEELLKVVTHVLTERYDMMFSIENEKEENDLIKASMILYDFAEAHGGISGYTSRWVGYVIGSLNWKKKQYRKFKVSTKVLLQDWFWNKVIIDYFVDTEQDTDIYLPEVHGEGTIKHTEYILSKEEAKELWPNHIFLKGNNFDDD
jgi:hypothetical protein